MDEAIMETVRDLVGAMDRYLYDIGYREDPQDAAELVSMLERGFEDETDRALFMELAEKLLNRTLPGLQMFVRDANLPKEIAARYEEGMILRNPAFTDASWRNGGMVTSHRYAILSNHMTDMSALTGEEDPRGLTVAKPGSYFQVLKIYKSISGETMILLLHLPDDGSWPVFAQSTFSVYDDIIDDSIDRFENKLQELPVEELTDKDWLCRCADPIGFCGDGSLMEL